MMEELTFNFSLPSMSNKLWGLSTWVTSSFAMLFLFVWFIKPLWTFSLEKLRNEVKSWKWWCLEVEDWQSSWTFRLHSLQRTKSPQSMQTTDAFFFLLLHLSHLIDWGSLNMLELEYFSRAWSAAMFVSSLESNLLHGTSAIFWRMNPSWTTECCSFIPHL